MTAPEQDGTQGPLVSTDRGDFYLDPDDQFISRSLLEQFPQGAAEIALATRHINRSSRVLVVGAHIGTIAIPLSRICRELVAVEANPKTCELLRRNVQLNGRDNMRVIEAAANHANGHIQFVMNTHNSGGSKRMPKFVDPVYFYDYPTIVPVPAKRLDDILDDAFDLVFMDIEGSEYFAFLGMQRLLAHAKTLIVEFLPHHLSRVAGITVETFLAPLTDHFDHLTIPTTGQVVHRDGFRNVLQGMFERNQGDPAIVFGKHASGR